MLGSLTVIPFNIPQYILQNLSAFCFSLDYGDLIMNIWWNGSLICPIHCLIELCGNSKKLIGYATNIKHTFYMVSIHVKGGDLTTW